MQVPTHTLAIFTRITGICQAKIHNELKKNSKNEDVLALYYLKAAKEMCVCVPIIVKVDMDLIFLEANKRKGSFFSLNGLAAASACFFFFFFFFQKLTTKEWEERKGKERERKCVSANY